MFEFLFSNSSVRVPVSVFEFQCSSLSVRVPSVRVPSVRVPSVRVQVFEFKCSSSSVRVPVFEFQCSSSSSCVRVSVFEFQLYLGVRHQVFVVQLRSTSCFECHEKKPFDIQFCSICSFECFFIKKCVRLQVVRLTAFVVPFCSSYC